MPLKLVNGLQCGSIGPKDFTLIGSGDYWVFVPRKNPHLDRCLVHTYAEAMDILNLMVYIGGKRRELTKTERRDPDG